MPTVPAYGGSAQVLLLGMQDLPHERAPRGIELDPDPRNLPAEPEGFHFLLRILVRPDDSEGRDLFDLIVCSTQWVELRECEAEGLPVSST